MAKRESRTIRLAQCGPGLVLMMMLAVGPVAFAELRCRIESPAHALQRLEVWGKEGAGATRAIVAHSSRHLAWVADRNGMVLEALFLVMLHTGNLTYPGGRNQRPQWVYCRDGG